MYILSILLALSLLNAGHSYKLLDTEAEILPSNCPSLIGCECIGGEGKELKCKGIGGEKMEEMARLFPNLEKLTVTEWSEKTFDLGSLRNHTSLKNLELIDSWIRHVEGFDGLDRDFPLEEISFNNNRLANWTEMCLLSHHLPLVRKISLRKNYYESVHDCEDGIRMNIKELDLSYNEIPSLSWNGSLLSLSSLSLDGTLLSSLSSSSLPSSLLSLSLSSSPLHSLHLPPLPRLERLDVSRTKLKEIPKLMAPRLKRFRMDGNQLQHADVSSFSSLSSLSSLSLAESSHLTSIYGLLPSSIEEFTLTHSQLTTLHPQFFSSSPSSLNLSSNPWSCSPCFLPWTLPVREKMEGILPNCTLPTTKAKCSQLEVSVPSRVSVENGREIVIGCDASREEAVVEWWLYRPATFLGSFDPSTKVVKKGNGSEVYEVLEGGSLRIKSASREVVERYVCVARVKGTNQTAFETTVLRLDFSQWYSIDILDSVFWGCLMSATLACAASFLLNITWILSRKSILWWIQRAERLSRVRKMVEAIEKYRQRQMDTIHDNYNKKVQTMRDTYHQQVDTLRLGYSSQVERFRDYRTAQMENVQSHLETLRENYQQQLHRARDYGSRRAEMLWESYERQMNRVRMFNLQSRLKMMRQYNLKQRYINKLFESFQKENADAETLRKHEEEVRAVLNLADDSKLPPLSRSPSYYSLPEYIVDEDGNIRPSPLVPSSPPIPFTRPSQPPNASPPPGPSTSTAL